MNILSPESIAVCIDCLLQRRAVLVSLAAAKNDVMAALWSAELVDVERALVEMRAMA